MTKETLNDYVNKIQAFNMNEDKRFDAVHIKDAVMAGYNICRSECEKADLEIAIRIGALEEENTKLKEKYNELSKAVFELKGEFMACPLDDMNRLSELIDRLNNL